VSERARDAKAAGVRLLEALYSELECAIDAACSQQYLALTIDGRLGASAAGYAYPGDDHLFAPLVARVVAELDADDLQLILAQDALALLRRSAAPAGRWLAQRVDLEKHPDAPVTLEHVALAIIERGLCGGLRRHLHERAAEFMPAVEKVS
jgi:hypothetical protein